MSDAMSGQSVSPELVEGRSSLDDGLRQAQPERKSGNFRSDFPG
ncbi:hypothetical protein MNBD_ALPHA04-1407, partial [hydrothermal vent metagenome]